MASTDGWKPYLTPMTIERSRIQGAVRDEVVQQRDVVGIEQATAARSSGAPAAQSGHGKMLLGAMESPLSHDSLRSLEILRV
jgi:hypothetical protein